ncbi:ABC transporter permease [Actinomadura nitritigenes]|uniref:ABC transporter permease n=1 Tax=Actinomadura nitritigenes TaxID=134602 RepID=UPI003D89C7F0
MSTTTLARPLPRTLRADWRGQADGLLPVLALVAMLGFATVVEPRSLSYTGLTLLLASALPLVLAAISQMFIIMAGDIDLGTGYLVGLTNAVAARYLTGDWWFALVMYAGLVVLYMLAAALVELRGVPSIIVTLGASFVWLGTALLVLPTPGGKAPVSLQAFFIAEPPLIPLPVLLCVAIGVLAYLLSVRMPYSAVIRGLGSNALALNRSGRSALKARVTCYGLAAVFGILAGLAVTGLTASGDANASANITLLAIAAVILGGGDFAGGRAVPFGAVTGALAISLVTSVLALFNVSSDYQTAVQGLILLLVLAGRIVIRKVEA